MRFLLTRALVRAKTNELVISGRYSIEDITVLYRDLHDIPDELRGACGSRKTASRCAHTKLIFDENPQNTFCHTGEWLLVLAAAGGVGMAAVQIGKGVPAVLRPSRVRTVLTSAST